MEEMSSTEQNHSVGWRRERQKQISDLREQSRNLRYNTYSGPAKLQVAGKTFRVEMMDNKPIIKVSAYDLQKRISAVKRFAETYNIEFKLTT